MGHTGEVGLLVGTSGATHLTVLCGGVPPGCSRADADFAPFCLEAISCSLFPLPLFTPIPNAYRYVLQRKVKLHCVTLQCIVHWILMVQSLFIAVPFGSSSRICIAVVHFQISVCLCWDSGVSSVAWIPCKGKEGARFGSSSGL